MKKHIFPVLILLLLAACRQELPAGVELEGDTDSESGLPLNPETPPVDGPFIIDGEIASMQLTRTTEPEFVIRIESGKTFRVRAQELAAITYDDGEAVDNASFDLGMHVRATIQVEEESTGTGDIRILRTSNLTVIR
jgi:hypothetical protein